MRNKKNQKSISRRGFIPLLGASMLIPTLGQATPVKHKDSLEDEEFTTMLTPDGNVVKVKRSALKKAEVLEKNMSNKSLLNWLKPKKQSKR
jgi:hypothetical protein